MKGYLDMYNSSNAGTKKLPNCRNLIGGSFGDMHHFMSLNADRGESHYNATFPVDEYGTFFGTTIKKQLERRAGTS